MTDERKFFLEQQIRIILSEYSEVRSEMKVNIQHQITLLATAMSTVGIAVGFAFTLLNRETINSPEIYRAIKFLLFVIVPGISTFFSMLWLDQVYRQLRIASYIRNIEIYLRKVVHNRTKFRFYHLPDGYEAYLDSMAEDNFINVHRLYYYMCLGVFLGQYRTIAEASAVESPIRQETIGFPAHFFARAHNFKPPGRACQPEADSPMRT